MLKVSFECKMISLIRICEILNVWLMKSDKDLYTTMTNETHTEKEKYQTYDKMINCVLIKKCCLF